MNRIGFIIGVLLILCNRVAIAQESNNQSSSKPVARIGAPAFFGQSPEELRKRASEEEKARAALKNQNNPANTAEDNSNPESTNQNKTNGKSNNTNSKRGATQSGAAQMPAPSISNGQGVQPGTQEQTGSKNSEPQKQNEDFIRGY